MIPNYFTTVIAYIGALSILYLIGSFLLLYKYRYASIIYDAIYRIIIIRVLILILLLISLFVNNSIIIHSYLLVIIGLILLIIIIKYIHVIGGSRKYYYVISKLPYTLGSKWLKQIFRKILVYVFAAVLYSPATLIIIALLPVAKYIISFILLITIISLIMLLIYAVLNPGISEYSVLFSILIDLLLITYTLLSIFGILTNTSLLIIFTTTYIYLLLYLGMVSSVTMNILKGIFNEYLPFYLIESKSPNAKKITSFMKRVLVRENIRNPLIIIVFSKPPGTLWDQLLEYFRIKKFKELNIHGLYNIVFSHYAVSSRLIDIEKCTIRPCIRVKEVPPNRSLITNELLEAISKNYTILVIIEDVLDLASMLGGSIEFIKFLKKLTLTISTRKNLYFFCIYPVIPRKKRVLGFIDEKIRLFLTSCSAGVAKI